MLLILAGVSISFVLGDKGVISNAKNAKIETRGASVEEQVGLWKLGNKAAVIEGKATENLADFLERMKGQKLLNEDEIKKINESGNSNKEITIGSKVISFLDENSETNEPETTVADGKWSTEKAANKPKITTSTGNSGLIPVSIADNGATTEKAINTIDWYDYKENTRQWGNAITKNSTNQTTGYFVWIPRYAYKINYTNLSNKSEGGTIDVVFLKNKTNKDKNGNDVTSAEYIDEKGVKGAYTVHPVFQDGSKTGYPNGEWRQEIEGIWVAKFEAGFASRK